MTADVGNPFSVLIESVKQVRVNTFTIGVVGIVAAAVTCIRLAAGNWLLALGGGAAVLVGMVVLRVFANPAESARKQPRRKEGLVLTWFCLLVFVVVVSFFVGKLFVILFPDWGHREVLPSPYLCGPFSSMAEFSVRPSTGRQVHSRG